MSTSTAASSFVLLNRIGAVALLQLNRPELLNALSTPLFTQLIKLLSECDGDPSCKVMVVTGSEKAFAAGADIKEMSQRTFSDNIKEDYLGMWTNFQQIRKPIIAAVNGFALGGGCELAMMCDTIFAGERAKFGQPEIKLGILPGGGGTQRLIRAVGKSLAMDMILSGRMITAEEARSSGLVSRIFPPEKLVDESIKIATSISEYSIISLMAAKEAINSGMKYFLAHSYGNALIARIAI